MIVTYRYRLLPTKRQHRALEKILEAQRQLYNGALEERIDAYRKAGITRRYIDQCKSLTQWRQSDSEAAELPVALQRWTLKQLDLAYNSFFRRVKACQKPGFPRFRGKSRFDSFGFGEFSGISLQRHRIKFRGLPGTLRLHLHRPLPEGCRICSCVLRRRLKGWYIGFAIEVSELAQGANTSAVALDLGISRFAAFSDGGFIPSLKASRRAERRMRVLQRALARKAGKSRGRKKALLQLVRCHAHVARQRAQHLHQASARLVRNYGVIAVERLNVKALARSVLAKQVQDASWGKFLSMLRYKAEWAGCRLIEIEPYDTSQECSSCGQRVPKLLSERLHCCEHCGLVMDRDLNAARNILKRAGVGPCLRNVAVDGKRAGGNINENVGAAEPAPQLN